METDTQREEMPCEDRLRGKREDSHVMKEAEIGVMQLHTKKHQGMPAPTEARRMSMVLPTP